MTIEDLINKIKTSERIAILPHIFADGDALGSSLALSRALSKEGKIADVILEEQIPSMYSFLPGSGDAIIYEENTREYDTAIALDTGDMERLGKRSVLFNKCSLKLNIDHHPTNTCFAQYNFVDEKASSVGEIVYRMIRLMGQEPDVESATCIYVAVATDTGGFRYSNTTAESHAVASGLIRCGLDISDISMRVFETASLEKTRLTGLAINTLELFDEGRIAFISVTSDMMKQTGAKDEDCDGIVNIARNVEGVEVAAMFREKDENEIKVNLRSKTIIDVSSIATTFGGGGHKRASGCTFEGTLPEAKEKILKEIRKRFT
jgi:phosphoesterase RecJ-like protein